MDNAPLLLITCEHGGNAVPAEYQELFAGADAVLATHRGWDPGALLLAEEMAVAFGAPLYASTTTRLLIDLNRSIGTPSLYSEYTRDLPAAARKRIVAEHYRPHHDPIEAWVAAALHDPKQRLIHIASHSFTPELDGVVRTADVGFLYNPRRPAEVGLCNQWLRALQELRPELRLRRNYPYRGDSDGLTYRLRRLYSPERYCGMELEVNQRFVSAGGKPWPEIRSALLAALRKALDAGFGKRPA